MILLIPCIGIGVKLKRKIETSYEKNRDDPS